MSCRTIWIYYCIAAAIAIALYVVGRVLQFEFANEMWTTVWGLVICANMYAIKWRDEKEGKH